MNIFKFSVSSKGEIHKYIGGRYGVDGNIYPVCACGNHFPDYKSLERHFKKYLAKIRKSVRDELNNGGDENE